VAWGEDVDEQNIQESPGQRNPDGSENIRQPAMEAPVHVLIIYTDESRSGIWAHRESSMTEKQARCTVGLEVGDVILISKRCVCKLSNAVLGF